MNPAGRARSRGSIDARVTASDPEAPAVRVLCFNCRLVDAGACEVELNRVHARRIGFVLVVLAGVWFELSPFGARAAAAVLDLQLLALDHWSPHAPAGDAAATDVAPATTARRPELRPLSRVMAMSLVVIAALVWWESRLLGWAIASSLAALAALLAVSTMMLPRGVLVPTAGPGAGDRRRSARKARARSRHRGPR